MSNRNKMIDEIINVKIPGKYNTGYVFFIIFLLLAFNLFQDFNSQDGRWFYWFYCLSLIVDMSVDIVDILDLFYQLVSILYCTYFWFLSYDHIIISIIYALLSLSLLYTSNLCYQLHHQWRFGIYSINYHKSLKFDIV